VDDAEHPAERVLAGEAFSDVLVGVVHRERPGTDWVHRVRGLVITDQAGRPDCLALVVHDATDWHEAERRFEQAFGANPAPAVILRLADMRYVKLNDGFLEMTGLKGEDVLGRTFDEVDVLEGAERRDLALERLRAGETIPQMEACLRVPVDADKLVVVAGQPIELGARTSPACCSPSPTWSRGGGPRPRCARARSGSSPASGWPRSRSRSARSRATGSSTPTRPSARRRATGRATSPAAVPPSSACGLTRRPGTVRGGAHRAGRVSGFEARLRPRDGAELDCMVSAEIVAIGDRPCFLWAFQDITDRKRSEGELVAAIEAVMADASWFSRGVVEKLALVRTLPGPGRARRPCWTT
jgi:PAS domain S-box-containing protein